MLQELPAETYLRWQRFHAYEPYWWEQLRYMLAKVCEVIAGTIPIEDKGKTQRVVYRKPNGQRATAEDFIPTIWLKGPPSRLRTPVKGKPSSTTARKVRRGMAAQDAMSFLAEL